MSRWRPGWLALALVAAALVVGCEDEPTIPEGPDMTSLVSIYDDPTGTLNEQNVEDVAESAAEQLTRIDQFGELEFVQSTVESVDDAIESFATERGDDRVGGSLPVNGVARFKTICPGWGSAERLDEDANGSLNATLSFRDSEYLPSYFGSFVSCQFMVDDVEGMSTPLPVELDAKINAYIGPGVALDLANLESTLFELLGVGRLEGEEDFPFEVDFRVFTSGVVETRVPSDDGDVIPFVDAAVPGVVGIRASNGSFCCDFGERICIQTQGSSCEDVTVGDTQLTW